MSKYVDLCFCDFVVSGDLAGGGLIDSAVSERRKVLGASREGPESSALLITEELSWAYPVHSNLLFVQVLQWGRSPEQATFRFLQSRHAVDTRRLLA